MSTSKKPSKSPPFTDLQSQRPRDDITEEIEELIEAIDPSLKVVRQEGLAEELVTARQESNSRLNIGSAGGRQSQIFEPDPTVGLEELIEQASPRSQKPSITLSPPTSPRPHRSLSHSTRSSRSSSPSASVAIQSPDAPTLVQEEVIPQEDISQSTPKSVSVDKASFRQPTSTAEITNKNEVTLQSPSSRKQPPVNLISLISIVMSEDESKPVVHTQCLPLESEYVLPGQVAVDLGGATLPIATFNLQQNTYGNERIQTLSEPEVNIITLDTDNGKSKHRDRSCLLKLCACIPFANGHPQDSNAEDERYIRSRNAIKMDFIEEIRIKVVKEDDADSKDNRKKSLPHRIWNRIRNLFRRKGINNR